jgi:hypothetical protein
LTHDGSVLIKSYQINWVILGQELPQLKTTKENREFGHNARSATSLSSLAGSSFTYSGLLRKRAEGTGLKRND